MDDGSHRFCKIFLRTRPSTAIGTLTELFERRFQGNTASLLAAEVEVLPNPDARAANSFLGWPTLLEIEANDDTDRASVVAITSEVLKAMWDAGIPAVAACDYEDELPWSGGIGRLNTPGSD
jgi:hypothetical protein